MKLDTQTLSAKSSGAIARNNMTIKADAFMFDTLFSGMYKNPIQAAIREIWANAYDANQNLPFDVYMPTALKTMFSVRDYGPGMSHDFVMNLYTQAGHSEKRETNDSVGGFGIGSKAPLAYCDSFNVTSIHEGMKSIYNIHREEDGMPVISCFYSEPTNEPSGVEVSFAVKQGDVMNFHREASDLLNGFVGENSYPLFKRYEQELKFPEIIFDDGEGNVIIRSSKQASSGYYNSFHTQKKVWVRMGCVAYPVEFHYAINHTIPRIRGTEFILKENIGSFRITRSRDSLITNESSESTIASKVKILVKKYIRNLNSEINKLNDIFEVYTHILQNYKTLTPEILRELTFQDEPVDSFIKINCASTPSYSRRLYREVRETSINPFTLNVNNSIFVVGNSKSKIPSRIQMIRDQNPRSEILYLEGEDDIDANVLAFLKNNFKFFYTEDFTPEKKSSSVKTDNIDIFSSRGSLFRDSYKTLNGTIYYLPKTKDGHFLIGNSNKEYTAHEASKILKEVSNALPDIFINSTKFVGIPKTKEARVRAHSGITLVNLNDFLTSYFDSEKQAYSDFKTIQCSDLVDYSVTNNCLQVLASVFLKNSTNKNISKYQTTMQRVNNALSTTMKKNSLTYWASYDTMDAEKSKEMITELKTLFNENPLLRFADKMTETEILNYIDLVGENQ